jgi:hydroxymethylglutaryl-CoA synthase
VDHSKPVSSYVHSALDIRASCRVFETKHACFGATAGLLGALEWIAAGNGSQRERVALVIASDIARYGLNTPGEPTQGGAAVAMVVRASPRLLALESPVGHFAKDVHDFWRPLPSKDALVDGAYSVTCYLDALRFAFEDYIDEVQSEAAREFARFDRMIYHVPYGKMAHKAHRHLCEIVEESDPSASFDAKVRPSLAFPKRVGNSYTGSLYLALASLLANDAELEKGTGRIALFSYGSGCGAAFFAGVAVPGAHARMKDVGAVLGAQKAITVREYEELFRARESIDTRPWSPSEGSTGRIRYLGVREGKRIYG